MAQSRQQRLTCRHNSTHNSDDKPRTAIRPPRATIVHTAARTHVAHAGPTRRGATTAAARARWRGAALGRKVSGSPARLEPGSVCPPSPTPGRCSTGCRCCSPPPLVRCASAARAPLRAPGCARCAPAAPGRPARGSARVHTYISTAVGAQLPRAQERLRECHMCRAGTGGRGSLRLTSVVAEEASSPREPPAARVQSPAGGAVQSMLWRPLAPKKKRERKEEGKPFFGFEPRPPLRYVTRAVPPRSGCAGHARRPVRAGHPATTPPTAKCTLPLGCLPGLVVPNVQTKKNKSSIFEID